MTNRTEIEAQCQVEIDARWEAYKTDAAKIEVGKRYYDPRDWVEIEADYKRDIDVITARRDALLAEVQA